MLQLSTICSTARSFEISSSAELLQDQSIPSGMFIYRLLKIIVQFCNASKMVSFKLILVPMLAAVSVLGHDCLDYHEANGIAKRWLSIWSSGTITKISQLETLVTKDVMSYDGTYGQATTGIDALFASCTYVDPLVKNVVQVPEWVFNNCDQIAARWSYNAISTGVATGNGPYVFLVALSWRWFN